MVALPRNPSTRQSFRTSAAVTPSATIHTYGAWASILDPIPYDIAVWGVDINDPNAVDMVLDVGLGPTGGGSENTIVSLPHRMVGQLGNHFEVPLWLKAGQRLSCRARANKASGAASFPDFNFHRSMEPLGPAPRQRATTYGLTNESGTVITSGTASAQGAFSAGQISASTTNPIRELIVCAQLSGTVPTTADVLLQVDVGIGASGSETMIIENLYFYYVQSRTVWPNAYASIPVNVPAGTRLALRTQAPNFSTAAVAMEFAVIGID